MYLGVPVCADTCTVFIPFRPAHPYWCDSRPNAIQVTVEHCNDDHVAWTEDFFIQFYSNFTKDARVVSSGSLAKLDTA